MTGRLALDAGRELVLSLLPLGPSQTILSLRRAPPEQARAALSA